MAAGVGRVVALGAEIAPDAPEKVFAVSGRVGEAGAPLVRAVARAGLWCADPDHRDELVHRLGRRAHRDRELGLVARAFEGKGTDGTGRASATCASARRRRPGRRNGSTGCCARCAPPVRSTPIRPRRRPRGRSTDPCVTGAARPAPGGGLGRGYA